MAIKIVWFILFLGTGCLVYNTTIGWQLIESKEGAEFHLTFSLFSVGVVLLSHLFLIQQSSKIIQKMVIQKVPQVALEQMRQTAVALSLGSLVSGLMTIITGTISHAGRFPFIHFLVIIIFLFLTLLGVWKWLVFCKKILPNSHF